MDFKKIVYLGVFLDDASKQALLEQFPPIHPFIHGTHVTLAFKPTEEELKRFETVIGKPARIDINGLKYNTKGQAIEVEILDDVGHDIGSNPFRKPGEQPLHVTISTAAGIPPKYSKELLQDEKVAWRPVSMKLTGVFDTWPNYGKLKEDEEKKKQKIEEIKAHGVPCELCRGDAPDPMTAAMERIAIGAKPRGSCCDWSKAQVNANAR